MNRPSKINFAINAMRNKSFKEALALLQDINLKSATNQELSIKGLCELFLQDWQSAVATFSAATSQFPDNAIFWQNRGLAEENLGQFKSAMASYEKSFALNNANAEVAGNLSNVNYKCGHFLNAENYALQALQLGAPASQALNSLGLALKAQAKFTEAERAFQKALAIDPTNTLALLNQANMAADLFNFQKSLDLFAQARSISDTPLARRDEGQTRLLMGDFETGWKLYESRLDLPKASRHTSTQPKWNGENIKGKTLIIFAEQGLGDILQFSRYQEFLPPDMNLIWYIPGNLVKLLSPVLKGSVVSEVDLIPRHDYWASFLSLPLLTKQFSPIPLSNALQIHPHIKLPKDDHKLNIGVVWAGSPTHARNFERSLPLKKLMDFLHFQEIKIFAPFKGPQLCEIEGLNITSLDALINDFYDTASLISQMDLIISVDTAVAHLAGMLGKKTYLMLPHCPDWRWGVKGKETVWYPSMQLIRQNQPGNWQCVFEEINQLLSQEIKKN